MALSPRSRKKPGAEQMTGDAIAEGQAAIEETLKVFQGVLEKEDQALKEQHPQGFKPMEAQARALLWLLALRDVHLGAVQEAVAEGNGPAASCWAEDLGKLSAAIAILETVEPVQ